MKYRRKVVEVVAAQFNGTLTDEVKAILDTTGAKVTELPDELLVVYGKDTYEIYPGEWVINDAGHLYKCQDGIFKCTYEALNA